MLSDCKNSNEVYSRIADVVLSVPLQDVKAHIRQKFYAVDDIVEFLYLTFSSKSNGILHGPGGFGKSQVTKAFLEFYNIPTLVKVGHSSMDVESLLGIPNIEKLTKESSYEIAFEKSIFSLPGVIILEEFLDVKPMVAAALKDILTEGGYRQNDTFLPSRNGPVIICSNKTPEEVSIDLSTAAFYKERFPYSMYVCWEDFSFSTYLNFFHTVYGSEADSQEYKLLADICSVSCKEDSILSPRLALKARDAFIVSKNLNTLKYISSIDFSKIEEVQYRIRERELYEALNNKLLEFDKNVNNLVIKTPEEYVALLYTITELKRKLTAKNLIGDDLLKTTHRLFEDLEVKLSESMQYALKIGSKHVSKLGIEYEDILKSV